MSLIAAAATAGQIGSIMNLAMMPFKLGAQNAQAAEQTYQNEMKRYAAARESMNAMNDEQKNIATLENQRILSDIQIESNQRQAEAQAKVQAAVQGVEGGAVDQVIQSTKINEALATGKLNQEIEEGIAQSIENISGAAYSLEMSTMPQFKSDAMKSTLGAVFGMSAGAFGLYTANKQGLFGSNDATGN